MLKNCGPDRQQKLNDIFINALHYGAKKSKFTLKIPYNRDQKIKIKMKNN